MSTPWNLSYLFDPPATHEAIGFEQTGVRSIYFDGPQYRGRSTRIFAYVGMPDGVSESARIPGIVLVHGGRGTAFAHWVRHWTGRGYAAISMDLNGRVPTNDGKHWQSHVDGGPAGIPASAYGEPHRNIFQEPLEPIGDAWAYHAVSAVVLANSWLRAQPGVDPARIGVTGVSWGAWTACNAVAIDPRFACAAPVYGCGFLAEGSAWLRQGTLDPQRDRLWLDRWDPGSRLSDASLPMLWMNGTNDFAYWPPAWTKSSKLPCGERSLCMILRMPHGHGSESENRSELLAFFDHHLRSGPAPARLKSQSVIGDRFTAQFEPPADRAIVRGELLYTTSTEYSWPERAWHTIEARLTLPDLLEAVIPEQATAMVLNAIDGAGLLSSSEMVDRECDPLH